MTSSVKAGAVFTVTASGKASRSYVLEKRASLAGGSWSTVVSVGPLAADGAVTLSDTSSNSAAAFYRIRVVAP